MRTLRSAGHQTHRPSRSHLYQDSLPFLCRRMSCPCGQLADRRGNLIFLSWDGGEALSFTGWRWVRRRRGRTRADKTTGAASPAFGLRHADLAPPRRSEATTRSTQSPRPSSLSLSPASPRELIDSDAYVCYTSIHVCFLWEVLLAANPSYAYATLGRAPNAPSLKVAFIPRLSSFFAYFRLRRGESAYCIQGQNRSALTALTTYGSDVTSSYAGLALPRGGTGWPGV